METPTLTTIDWLKFRTQGEPGQVLEALRAMFPTFASGMSLSNPERGKDGWLWSQRVILDDAVPVARMDFGGEAQRGWLRCQMTGRDCGHVEDWRGVEAIEDLPSAELRRVDLALTTWRGEVTHERVVQAHADGKFSTRGRPPNLQQVISSDPTAGRTCYVGSRASDKFLRCYEKGHQLAAQTKLQGVTHIEGFPVGDIYRCELECKAQEHVLPWEVVPMRDQYFAGAYPFCRELLPEVQPDILQRRPERVPQAELAAALACVRAQWGDVLFTALTAYQGDIGEVWSRIVGRKHSQRLVEAGVLLYDHQ